MNPKPTHTQITFVRKKLLRWSKGHFVEFPWRRTENRWHAIVAEVMLQRTKAEQVLAIYNDFVKKYPTAEKFLIAPKRDREAVFESLGLAWRRKTLHLLAKHISRNGIPSTKSELLMLPSIGDYVASAFLSFHLNKREPLIDSNIVRFYGRFFGFPFDNETRRKKWLKELGLAMTPTQGPGRFNYALLDFSMTVCAPKPRCSACDISSHCCFALARRNSRDIPKQD